MVCHPVVAFFSLLLHTSSLQRRAVSIAFVFFFHQHTHTYTLINLLLSLSLSSSSFFFFFFLYCSWPTKKPSGRVLFFDPRQQKPLRYFSLIIAAAATVMADSQLFNIHSNKLVVPSRSSAAAAAAHQLISDFSISIEYYL